MLTATDANGHTTINAYDTNGFVIAQTDAATNTTQFQPNELGWNLRTINALNRVKTQAEPNGTVRTLEYDRGGRLTNVTFTPTGRVNRFA